MLMDDMYRVFHRANCIVGCVPRSPTCAKCAKVRTRLKIYYMDKVIETVFGHVGAMFDARNGPFRECPTEVLPDCYQDDACQVDRLPEELASNFRLSNL
jgi:hypothetical protein